MTNEMTKGSYNDQKLETLRILLIEDNPYDQQLFLEHLTDTAYAMSEVTVTDAMAEAEGLKEKHQFDAVVADMNLMDVSQVQTINRLNRSFAHLPIVLLTGSKDLEMARQAIRSGIQTYLIKDMQTPDTLNLALLQAQEHFKLSQSMRYTINNLYQKSRVQNQITRSMSHDYRSPINNIISLLGLMEQDQDNTVLYREKILLSAQRMLQHLEENLDILKSPFGMESKPENIRLNELVDEIKVQIEHELLDASIQCDCSALKEFRYPPFYLRGYMLNLLTNAVKYRHPSRRPVINISTKKLNDFVCITVSDNGLGIDMEKHGKEVFGFKQRFHDHLSVSGTGLGLFNLKNQIESLNGKIEVESEVNKGSTFTLYLPEF